MTGAWSPAVLSALGGFSPSDEQWAAIAHDPVPLAVIAGAGSGKTAVVAARIVWMIEEGIARPSQILALSFSNRSVGELEERVMTALEAGGLTGEEAPHIDTYNAFSDKIVREHGTRIGIDPRSALLSEAQRWQLVTRRLDDAPDFETLDVRSTAWICRTVIGLAEECANHLLDPARVLEEDARIVEAAGDFPEDVVETSKRRKDAMRVVGVYMQAKRAAQRIDYGDQIAYAVRILEASPGLREALQRRWSAILLDEYQDTNVAQRRLMQLLAPEGHNVTAVGDARQNIYQWRGSTIFNLIDFPSKHFLRAGGEAHAFLSLSRNYRSGSAIIEAANAIIDQVPADRRPGSPMSPDPSNGRGRVMTKLCADQAAEAAFIASQITGLHGTAAGTGGRQLAWGDFAILVRRKSHIPAIYDALRESGVPVEVVGLGGLLEVPEVGDLVAWMKVLNDPGPASNVALARILMGPRFRVHYRDLALLARWAAARTRELRESREAAGDGDGDGRLRSETAAEPDEVSFSLCEALENLEAIERLGPEAAARLGSAARLLGALRAEAGGSLAELAGAIVRLTGLGETIEASPRPDAASRLRNLGSFQAIVATFAPVEGDPDLGAFLEYLDAAAQAEEALDTATPAPSDSVKLMTIHQAKGLEYEAVFLPAVAASTNDSGEKVNSIFPDERVEDPSRSYGHIPVEAREDRDHLPRPWTVDSAGKRKPKPKAAFQRELKERAREDERRLMYVAMTRARQHLWVLAAHWYERDKKPRGPSLFFDEVAATPVVENLPGDEVPDHNPLLGALAVKAVWPPDPHGIVPDEVFPQGHPAAIEGLISVELSAEELLSRLDAGQREAALSFLEQQRARLALLASGPPVAAPRSALPGSLSATVAADLLGGLTDTVRIVRPLPERPTEARRIGMAVHSWIEETARGLTGLVDEEVLDEPSEPVTAARIAELKEAFQAMGYDRREYARLESGEPMAEVPFMLKAGQRLIRGRIDAVYEAPGGGLEIVDFKTGGEVEHPPVDQLAIYAAALNAMGIRPDRPLKLAYCYLATRRIASREITAEEAGALARHLPELLDEKLG